MRSSTITKAYYIQQSQATNQPHRAWALLPKSIKVHTNIVQFTRERNRQVSPEKTPYNRTLSDCKLLVGLDGALSCLFQLFIEKIFKILMRFFLVCGKWKMLGMNREGIQWIFVCGWSDTCALKAAHIYFFVYRFRFSWKKTTINIFFRNFYPAFSFEMRIFNWHFNCIHLLINFKRRS